MGNVVWKNNHTRAEYIVDGERETLPIKIDLYLPNVALISGRLPACKSLLSFHGGATIEIISGCHGVIARLEDCREIGSMVRAITAVESKDAKMIEIEMALCVDIIFEEENEQS